MPFLTTQTANSFQNKISSLIENTSLHGPPLDPVAEPHDAAPRAVEKVPLAVGDPLERRDAVLRDERRLRSGGAGGRRRPHLEHAVHVAARHHRTGSGEAAVRDLGVVLQVLFLAQKEVV